MEGLTDKTSIKIRDLTTGEKLQFRVRAYNMAGPSSPTCLTQPVTIREIMREWTRPTYIHIHTHICIYFNVTFLRTA